MAKDKKENKLGIEDITETQNAWDDFCDKIVGVLEDGNINSAEAIASYLKLKKFLKEVTDVQEMHEQIDDADPSELRTIAHGLVDNIFNGHAAGSLLIPYLKNKWTSLLALLGIGR